MRFFKQQTGMTIIDYVYRIRSMHVYNEVLGTDHPIETILADKVIPETIPLKKLESSLFMCDFIHVVRERIPINYHHQTEKVTRTTQELQRDPGLRELK